MISSGYAFAKPQRKLYKDSNDYDHLDQLGLNQNTQEEHNTNDTYEHAHVEGNGNNDTYSQSGQYTHTDTCTSARNGQVDNAYEQTRNVRYGESDTYDHSRSSVNDAKEEYSDYAYAYAQNSAMEEGDYDHARSGDRNDIQFDTYK